MIQAGDFLFLLVKKKWDEINANDNAFAAAA
jgi:hypothetical protein